MRLHFVFYQIVVLKHIFGSCHGEATPYLDKVRTRLREVAPNAEDRVWKLTRGNTLEQSWLLQSPNCWGDPDPNQNCARQNAPGALALAAQIEDDIASATEWVDITTLADGLEIATGIFRKAIVQGIRRARAKYPNITVRILGGTPPTKSDPVDSKYMKRLLEDLGSAANGSRIFVAGIEPYFAYSWNHAKIVAVDGKTAIVGGHNLYDEAYNSDHPINDVSMRVVGPAASMGHAMADVLWNFTCEYINTSRNVGLTSSPAVASAACPKNYSHAPPPSSGNVSVLAMGMLGYGIDPLDNTSGALPPAHDAAAACVSTHGDYFNDDLQFSVDNPDLEGRRALIESATKSVFIAQQDLVFDYCNWWDNAFVSATYDTRLFKSIANKLLDGVLVTIVVSTPKDQGDTDGYSYMNKMNEIPTVLLRKLQEHFFVSRAVATEKLCKYLRLASVRIAHNMSAWASGFAIGQHAKVLAVDDAAFYIGSHNLYPTTLQEFGYLVEDANAASHLKETFFDKLWMYSRENAIIDPDVGRCNISGSSSDRLHGNIPSASIELMV